MAIGPTPWAFGSALKVILFFFPIRNPEFAMEEPSQPACCLQNSIVSESSFYLIFRVCPF